MNSFKTIFLLPSLVLIFLVGCASNSNSQSPVKNISQEEMQTLMKDTNVVVLDVRTPEEVSEGYIEGTTLFINYNGSTFDSEVVKLDKSKSYIVYCRSGGRSSNASNVMLSKGFTKVYNLLGGISNWTGPVKR